MTHLRNLFAILLFQCIARLDSFGPTLDHVEGGGTFETDLRLNSSLGWSCMKFYEILTHSTLGKRAPFSQNSHKWRPLSENVRLFLRNEHFPWETCVIFAEFAKMTAPFWKRSSFSQKSTFCCEILWNSEPPGRHLLHIGLLIHGCTLGKIMFFPGTPTMY